MGVFVTGGAGYFVSQLIRDLPQTNVYPQLQVTTTQTPSLIQLSSEVDGSRFRALDFRPKMGIVEGVRELAGKFHGIRPVPLPAPTLAA